MPWLQPVKGRIEGQIDQPLQILKLSLGFGNCGHRIHGLYPATAMKSYKDQRNTFQTEIHSVCASGVGNLKLIGFGFELGFGCGEHERERERELIGFGFEFGFAFGWQEWIAVGQALRVRVRVVVFVR